MPFISNTQWRQLRQKQKLLGQEVLMYQRVMEGMRRNISQESLFKLTIRSVQKGLGFKRCGIFLTDEQGQAMTLALGVDKKGRFEKGKDRFPIVRRRNANAFSDIANGYLKYYFTNHLSQRQHKGDRQRVPARSTAVVPIQVGDNKIIGALAVDQLNDRRVIARSDVMSLFNFATQVGMALQSLKAHELVVQQSVTDPLTGLANRRFFEKALAEELRRCEKSGRSCSLVLADLDYFKKVNDSYGHDVGDEFLKHVARILHGCVRGLDRVARIGGEEFALLLPDTPPDSASFLVQRLLRQVRENPPRLAELGADPYPLTVSFGTTIIAAARRTAARCSRWPTKASTKPNITAATVPGSCGSSREKKSSSTPGLEFKREVHPRPSLKNP